MTKALNDQAVLTVTGQASIGRKKRWSGQAVALGAAVVELVVPITIAYGVGKVLEGGAIGPAVWAPVLVAVALSGVFAACQVLLLSRIAAEEMRELRLTVATRLINLMPRTIEQLGAGEAVALYSHYANKLEALLTADRIRRRTAIATLVGCLALMTGFDWRLTLALIAALIVVGMVIVLVLSPVKRRAAEGLEALSDTTADISEYLGSIRSATVYGLSTTYARRFGSRLNDVALAERRVGHAQALVDLIVKTTSMLLLISLGVLGMRLVADGSLSAANLSGFLGALTILLAPAAKYTDLLQSVRAARAAESRIEDLLWENELQFPSLSASAPIDRYLPIEFVGAVISPADGLSVGPITFSAEPGEVICIAGPSGSGKTTVLSTIAGFAPKYSGCIKIGDQELHQWEAPDLWRSIGYVEQGTPTLGATVRSFLSPDEESPPADATLRHLLASLGLEGRLEPQGLESPLERDGASLSGGERQRLSIARALASDRPLLLLDEPTAHLDSHSEASVIDTILEFCPDRTVIVATHSEAVIERADRIVALDAPTLRMPGLMNAGTVSF